MLIAAVLFAVPIVEAQTPEFEVASIKVNLTGSGGSSFSMTRGKVTETNVSLLGILQAAYALGPNRVIGPAWLDSDRFDVIGKAPEGIPDSEMPAMLQALLKDRFHLAVHWEKRELPVFEMVVAKGGLKLVPFDPANANLELKPHRGGASIMGVGAMPELAKAISASAGRPVIDKTALQGKFIYQLSFTPLSTSSETASDPSPDFFAAVEEQLGLKLAPRKAPVDVLVIDHADRLPSAN
ncbi:MAG TPA: TIGR03435 family protein [Bryobacteraceae bacterium]|nr:TIGR03435 family protein [Bryobacteraceae bacterium]